MTIGRIAVACMAAFTLFACGSEEELGSTNQALRDDDEGTNDCADTQRLLAAAPADRKPILQRAARWVQSPVEYSQSNYQDGYRCDCSGYVAMAWDNGESFTTSQLPPRTNDTTLAYPIQWTEMLPGDAVNSEGHMRFYAGMSATGDPCFWEQAHSGTSTMAHPIPVDTLAKVGYQPVRSTRLFDTRTSGRPSSRTSGGSSSEQTPTGGDPYSEQ